LKTKLVLRKEKDVEITFLPKHLSTLLFAATALAAAAVGAPGAAQTGPDPAPPPAASPAPPSGPSSSEVMAHFVASAIPTVNFIATASRLAISNSPNSKIQKFAETLANDQAKVANSLAAWVNVNNTVVTLINPYTGKVGPGAPRLSAPNLLPSQVSDLRRLSASQGRSFDTLYVSTLVGALVQLQVLYRDFLQDGTDPGLRAIASRELPKLEQTISALDKL
jgi:predicted outer membrane protein